MRGVPRWFAVLAVVVSVVVVCAFTLRRAFAPPVLELRISTTQLAADGVSSAQLRVRSTNHRDLRDLKVEADGRVAVQSLVVQGDSATATLRAGVQPGAANVRISGAGFEPRAIVVTATLAAADSYDDGTPDFLRLQDAGDRNAFRGWFTLIGESQYYSQDTLPAEIDDCAALLRFSYREALRRHDSAWVNAMALPVAPRSGELDKYVYPHTPLGAAMFRVRDGSFESADLSDGAFAEFADAKTLWRNNTHYIGRNIAQARPGDLLFFRQSGHDLPFHAMIFLGHSQVEPGSAQYVVYHTGPEGRWKGEVRRPTVAELLNHPDSRWHPIASNPAFLGVYRWNILRGDQ